MKTNNELRTRIAESLGWIRQSYETAHGPRPRWVKDGRVAYEDNMDGLNRELPDYLTDPAAAIGLCEVMKDSGYLSRITNGVYGWHCLFIQAEAPHAKHEAHATGPHAFCSAICGAYAKARNLTLTEEPNEN